ncbi:MAG: SDR family oxidoreductase, partial [Spirochaetales bacterium]|nr:SDR family oxidoreductase [Spirochaetales bacterium]
MIYKHVVITGSTRGIGLGLAVEFLERGCAVTLSGRTQAGIDAAVLELSSAYDPKMIFGFPCNVASSENVQTLWNRAEEALGTIAIWINNAGVGQSWACLHEIDEDEVGRIVDTNIIGAINGFRVAVRGMLNNGSGQIYSMEGYGSDGRNGQLLTIYGMTKSALHYVNKSLAKELADTPVQIGALYPGMVVTDLLTSPMAALPEEFEKAKKIFNIIADKVETVTPYLVEKILKNRKNGVRIAWLSPFRILLRFFAAPFRKRD